LTSALAGRDGVGITHWWTGVGHYAGDQAVTQLLADMNREPLLATRVCTDVFGLSGREDDVQQIAEWAKTAAGAPALRSL